MLGAARADRDRCLVTVCYIRDGRDQLFELDARARSLGIDYVEVHERHSFDPAIWRQLIDLVRARRIDVVHAHEYKTDVIAWFLARRLGVVPIATAHGWTGQSRRERWAYYPADKRLLARFPRVIAVSTDIQSTLVRHGARQDRVDVLLNAIDTTAFRRVPARRDHVRRAMGYEPEDIVIGAVGRLERQKRFDLLLEAMAALRHETPALQLVVVGDGSLRGDLDALARRLDIADRCQWLGHRTDVADLHHGFDLFVQSSEYEGTPNAVLEAMAMETPIVATDAGGTGEVAIDGLHAILVPMRDVPALVGGIRAVLDAPDQRRARVTAARQRVETELSFEARTRRLEEIYTDVAARRTGELVAVSEQAGARSA
jgi:glycosyltransferase involved in cell wall biosynthesis